MAPYLENRDLERRRWDHFLTIPELEREPAPARHDQGLAGPAAALRVLGSLRRLRRDALHQARQPALRRPHDRGQRHGLLVDLRRQPAHHAVGRQRRRAAGPAWNNSLFEDNAEFGLGMRLALDVQTAQARGLLERLAPPSARTSLASILDNPQDSEAGIARQRAAVERLRTALRARRRRAGAPTPARSSRSRATSCAPASGSWAATAGPTTSASAASTRP